MFPGKEASGQTAGAPSAGGRVNDRKSQFDCCTCKREGRRYRMTEKGKT
jgi:hypothetical protein